jgi:hypothetical protein
MAGKTRPLLASAANIQVEPQVPHMNAPLRSQDFTADTPFPKSDQGGWEAAGARGL